MQALELIRELQAKYPITRARMKLRFVVPTNQIDQLSTALSSWNSQIEGREETSSTTSLVCIISNLSKRLLVLVLCDLILKYNFASK